MEELVRNGKFDVLVGHYAHPGGDPAFIRALVCFLNERCGWNLTPENVAITQGGQMACFTLFNMLAAAGLPPFNWHKPASPEWRALNKSSIKSSIPVLAVRWPPISDNCIMPRAL